jgi:hypothetical protein
MTGFHVEYLNMKECQRIGNGGMEFDYAAGTGCFSASSAGASPVKMYPARNRDGP